MKLNLALGWIRPLLNFADSKSDFHKPSGTLNKRGASSARDTAPVQLYHSSDAVMQFSIF